MLFDTVRTRRAADGPSQPTITKVRHECRGQQQCNVSSEGFLQSRNPLLKQRIAALQKSLGRNIAKRIVIAAELSGGAGHRERDTSSSRSYGRQDHVAAVGGARGDPPGHLLRHREATASPFSFSHPSAGVIIIATRLLQQLLQFVPVALGHVAPLSPAHSAIRVLRSKHLWSPAIIRLSSLFSTMSKFRHPVIAVSHGPGPLWLLNDGFSGMNRKSVSAQNVRDTFAKLYPSADQPLPKRILFVSAHWESESSGFEISSSQNPDMIYDYYGFPDEAYDVVSGAKGDPAFAKRVADALTQSKIAAKLVDRGYDHGVFVPMSLIRPEADIPITSMSINDNLSPKAHFELGKALAQFRDEDTLIICSGQATHNLRASRNPSDPISEWAMGFQDWMDNVFTSASKLNYAERAEALATWVKTAPFARLAHPSPDHFSPFIVAAGAGMDEAEPVGEKIIEGWGAGQLSFATYAWGINK